MLESNLVRRDMQSQNPDDDNLRFDYDLLFLDVWNRRVGINTEIPFRDLLVNGDISSSNIISNTLSVPNFLISGNTISNTDDDILLSAADPNGQITANRLRAGQIEFDGQTISSTVSNADIELHTSGSGQVYVYNQLDIQGDLHATGNIVADGNLVLGDSDTDSIIFNAEFVSDIVPDLTDTYSIGNPSKQFGNMFTYLINGQNFVTGGAVVGGVDLSIRPGNTWYVSTNGNNTNVGDHPNGPFATIEYALSQASAGDTIHIYSGTYMEYWPLIVPVGVSVIGSGIRSTKIIPQAATNDKDAFLLNGETSISDITISNFFYNSVANTGYAFRFANNFNVTSRSPYIQNITVITENESSLASAGRGAYIDGSVANAASKEASMLFHSVTFITPGADCLVMKNGVRVEWLNSFIYYANKGLYAENGSLGFASLGLKFGAEVRSIGSANVYGTYGAWADGAEVLMYLINHNFGYIGSGLDNNNDPTDTIQANEVVTLNNGKIYYQSVDHKGDFRVGDVLLIEQSTGRIVLDTFDITSNSITIQDGTNTTYIDPTTIQTGNIQISGNTISSTINQINLSAFNSTITVSSNLTVQNFSETQNFTANGNTNLGNSSTSNVTVNSRIDSNLLPNNSLNNIGSFSLPFNELFAERLLGSDIIVDGNVITTTQSNSDLELRANSTGNILINDTLTLNQNLNVQGISNFLNVNVPNTITANGSLILTNYTVDEYNNGQILITDNFITTIESNSPLELRAQGLGGIIFDQALKVTDSNISNILVSGTESQRSIIFTPLPGKFLDVNTNTALKISTGTSATRTLSNGEIRFNTANNLYEGAITGGTKSLVGLYDIDKNTYITTENVPGANDNTIRMYTNGILSSIIDNNKVQFNDLFVDEIRINSNTINTFNTNADLELQTSGTGILNINNNFAIDTISITNLNPNVETTINSTGLGYVKFDSTGAIRIPTGTDAERPVGVPVGASRFNTDQAYLEVWDGTTWNVATGGGPIVTAQTMEELGDIYALIFG